MRGLAQGVIWLIPVGAGIGWLRGSWELRGALVMATLAGLLSWGINQWIGLVWYHPRPFELGIGHTWLDHVRNTSFPSGHLTLIWTVAFGLLAHRGCRRAGSALALLGLPVAWARIYLGLHFPLDMLGAALTALGSAATVFSVTRRAMPLLMRGLMPIHQVLFANWIDRGWVRK